MTASSLNLRTIIDDGIDAVVCLDALLSRERSALEDQDARRLSALATEKQACLDRIEELEASRAALLHEHGLGNNNLGMNTLLEASNSAGAWHRYLDLAGRCHTANQTNGAIIRLRHQQISSALAVISGERQSTYGPSGKAPPAKARERALA
ncbi:MAG: flagellar protein FlgN [Halioglobus sp.]|nr:flagellar protein FlgN [Halioglobus sp.]